MWKKPMRNLIDMVNRVRRTIAVGLILCVALLVQCTFAPRGAERTGQLVKGPSENEAYASVNPPPAIEDTLTPQQQLERQLQAEPLTALKSLLADYEREVRDYRCTFIKKERVNGTLRHEQTIQAKFKEDPFSVHLNWTALGDSLAQQAIFVEGKWTGDGGEKLAQVQPAGLIKVLAKRVAQDIHGSSAKKASRKFIDAFGVANSLRMIIEYSQKAYERGELQLKYMGAGEIAGRPTFVIERRLPFTGEDGEYPDKLLIVHIDQEYGVPAAAMAYSSDTPSDETLLGSYLWTDLQLNVGLADADFEPEANGF
jgi:hypothetical protein